MNQEDYKVIAKIIKVRLNVLRDQKTTYDCEEYSRLGSIDELERFVHKLTDYFEKKYQETTHCYKCNLRLVRGINCPKHGLVNVPFNRKRFLKMCGGN